MSSSQDASKLQAWFVWAAAGVALLLLAADGWRDHVLYNGSSSMPIGFYLRTEGPPVRGAIVTVRARDVARDYAQLRNFTDEGDRFIKHVVATDGDVVCATGDTVTINGQTVARRQASDRQGRTLPSWSGCTTLQEQVLLLGETEDSFDGRYWGPIDMALIEGVWIQVR